MQAHQLPGNFSLYTSQQVRDIEANYAATHDQSTYPLMEAAGLAAYQLLRQKFPQFKRILVITGKGNNGGDGYIVARLALMDNLQVTLCGLCEPENIKGDAAKAYQLLSALNPTLVDWQQVQLADYDVVVDAILGTGISGDVRQPMANIISEVNQSQIPVLAIDVPSGIDADTGNVSNVAIKANCTATYIGYKRGCFTGDALEYQGELKLFDLSVEDSCFAEKSNLLSHNWESISRLIKPRKLNSHKGLFGHCKIIGGSAGMAGAALMASAAAARCGSGLVSAWIQQDATAIVTARPEVMAKNTALEEIADRIASINNGHCLVIGPGLGQSSWGKKWMLELHQTAAFKNTNKVIDADALNWLAKHQLHNQNWILTPHPGEAARLIETDTQTINRNRFESSQKIATTYGGICVLKGAGTVISAADGRQVVCPVGNPGMASGGMGDVLSGLIGAFVAQGFDLFEAAILGVCLHGEAADLAAGKTANYRGLLASDLLLHINALVNP